MMVQLKLCITSLIFSTNVNLCIHLYFSVCVSSYIYPVDILHRFVCFVVGFSSSLVLYTTHSVVNCFQLQNWRFFTL